MQQEEITEPRPKPGYYRSGSMALSMGIALLILYPLSMGPAAWFSGGYMMRTPNAIYSVGGIGGVDRPKMSAFCSWFYVPVAGMLDYVPYFREVMERYIRLWNGFLFKVRLRPLPPTPAVIPTPSVPSSPPTAPVP